MRVHVSVRVCMCVRVCETGIWQVFFISKHVACLVFPSTTVHRCIGLPAATAHLIDDYCCVECMRTTGHKTRWRTSTERRGGERGRGCVCVTERGRRCGDERECVCVCECVSVYE